jgi:hypothetical protein
MRQLPATHYVELIVRVLFSLRLITGKAQGEHKISAPVGEPTSKGFALVFLHRDFDSFGLMVRSAGGALLCLGRALFALDSAATCSANYSSWTLSSDCGGIGLQARAAK